MDKVIRNKKNMKKHLSKNVQRENLFENCIKKKKIYNSFVGLIVKYFCLH